MTVSTCNLAGVDVGRVNANELSNVQLGTGVYSLSSRSNVPYVTLVGRNFTKKFSWGEYVEVPDGQSALVKNASFHTGDIFLNGGREISNRPKRVTVPVPFEVANQITIFGNTYWRPNFPCDVRLARQAYLAFDAAAVAAGTSLILVAGTRVDGSHDTQDEIQSAIPGVRGSGYADQYDLTDGALIGLIPLGHLAALGDDTRPHALLSTATPFIQTNAQVLTPLPNAYYVLEY